MTIAATRYAAPLPPMVFRGVIKTERAGIGVGAPMEVSQISLSQEDGNLASEDNQGEFLPVKLRT